MIRGRIMDLHPNRDTPELELNFDPQDRPFLPKGRLAEIKLDLGGGVLWRGTINSEHGSPCVHAELTGNGGTTTTCTDLFFSMGLAEKALLDFKRELDGTLRLVRIPDKGKWREGSSQNETSDTLDSAVNHEEGAPLPADHSSELNPAIEEVEQLVASLSNDFPVLAPSSDKAWTRPLAVRVIDCVLSLNRKYDGFVVPRLDAFEKKFPHIESLRDLRDLMGQFASPHDFVKAELNYNHEERAEILSGVVDYLTRIIGDASSDWEPVLLEEWAKKARPEEVKTKVGIPGFGIAGFQYLRMLMGANTSKPDKHIIRYVSNAAGRSVSTYEALSLLETAAERLDISLRDLDTNIWELSARGNNDHESIRVKPETPPPGMEAAPPLNNHLETGSSPTPDNPAKQSGNEITGFFRKILVFLSGSSHQAPKD